jgi:hypothetical protein
MISSYLVGAEVAGHGGPNQRPSPAFGTPLPTNGRGARWQGLGHYILQSLVSHARAAAFVCLPLGTSFLAPNMMRHPTSQPTRGPMVVPSTRWAPA